MLRNAPVRNAGIIELKKQEKTKWDKRQRTKWVLNIRAQVAQGWIEVHREFILKNTILKNVELEKWKSEKF